MKTLTTIFLLLTVTAGLFGEIAVKSFRKLETDLDARVYAKKIDQNGDVCAIIKVVTTQNGFIWEPDGLGIIKSEWKNGEYWLYLPYGAKHLTIKHDKLGILRDYMYPIPIEKATVYEMVLISGKVITSVEEEIASQWLIINTEPEDAMVYMDGQFMKNGMYQTKLKPGKYTYRVESPLYHPEIGIIHMTDVKNELNVKLKPAFGDISVTTEPEQGAKVIVDGRVQLKTTPCKTEPLTAGEHNVQVVKEMYQPVTKKIMVAEGQTTPLSIVMESNFAEVSIVTKANATIYINNQLKDTSAWHGRLIPGVYTLEAKLERYRTAKQDIEVADGDKRSFTLQPTPIYGALDVISTPAGAKIRIDSATYQTTPSTIEKLLIGKHTVQLQKTGYATKTDTINITEGKNTEFNTILQKARTVIVTSNPQDVDLYVDNLLVGKTPQQLNLTYGNHDIRIQKDGKKTEKSINIQEKGRETTYDLTIESLVVDKPQIADSTKLSKFLKRYDIYLFGGITNPGVVGDFKYFEFGYDYKIGIAKKIGMYISYKPAIDNYLGNAGSGSGIYKVCSGRMGLLGGCLFNIKPIVFHIKPTTTLDIPIAIPITFHAGAGWGYYKNYTIHFTNETDFVNYTPDVSTLITQKKGTITYNIDATGIETNAGVIIGLKPFGFSIGVTSVAFKYVELKLGAGLIL